MWTILILCALAAVAWGVIQGMKRDEPDDYGEPQHRKAGQQKATLRITYRDFEGKETTRDVTPYTRATNDRFRAFCHLRQEPREFVFDRVVGGVNLETGEVLDRAGVFKHIHPTRKVPAHLQ